MIKIAVICKDWDDWTSFCGKIIGLYQGKKYVFCEVSDLLDCKRLKYNYYLETVGAKENPEYKEILNNIKLKKDKYGLNKQRISNIPNCKTTTWTHNIKNHTPTSIGMNEKNIKLLEQLQRPTLQQIVEHAEKFATSRGIDTLDAVRCFEECIKFFEQYPNRKVNGK
jgi:hypothetical protein